jgi:hypothetical protein
MLKSAWVLLAVMAALAGMQKARAQGFATPPTSAQLADLSEAGHLVEHEPPAATVRTFYEALGAGQGEVASLMVAPEKRGIPAFSASAMSHFYGSLREPLRLTDIEQRGPDTFTVYYSYASSGRACDGKAIVRTSSRAGSSYIESIQALNGC